MEEVKVGTTVTIDGVTHRFGEGSAEAYNTWLELQERGLSEEANVAEIHLYKAEGEGGRSFSPQEIREALEG